MISFLSFSPETLNMMLSELDLAECGQERAERILS